MTRRCGRLTWASSGAGEANEASARPASTRPLPTSITPIRIRKASARILTVGWVSMNPEIGPDSHIITMIATMIATTIDRAVRFVISRTFR